MGINNKGSNVKRNLKRLRYMILHQDRCPAKQDVCTSKEKLEQKLKKIVYNSSSIMHQVTISSFKLSEPTKPYPIEQIIEL